MSRLNDDSPEMNPPDDFTVWLEVRARDAVDPRAALDSLGAKWSPDFGAYASGELDASKVRCALCSLAPCDCPPSGTPEYLALLDKLRGRNA